MKRLAYTAVVTFWSVIATLVIVARLSSQPEETATVSASPLTLEDLAAHASPDDCWIVVRGQVYDVTSYIPAHPTRPSVITEWCGKDATEAFETKVYGRPHSPAAWDMLEQYRVGTLKIN